jgi:hypothetical protein
MPNSAVSDFSQKNIFCSSTILLGVRTTVIVESLSDGRVPCA